MFEPTVQDDTRALQRGINRLSTARMGPVSVGPGDGHIRFYAADGRTLFQVNSAGASVEHRGSLTGLTPLLGTQSDRLDGHDADVTRIDATDVGQDGRMDTMQVDIDRRATKTYVDGNINTLQGVDAELQADINTRATRTYVDGNISTLVDKNASQDADIGTRATKTYVDGNVSTLVSKNNSQDTAIGAAQSRADSAYSRAGNALSDAADAHARADSAYSRAGTGITNAATAQSRADSAYALASNAATSGELRALRDDVRDWMARAQAANPALPDPIPA